MPLRNATEIYAAVGDYMNTTEATASRLSDWIRLAEKRIARSLSNNGMLHKLSVAKNITLDASPKSLPSGIRGLPDVVYIDADPKAVLEYMTPDEFFGRWLGSETGKPTAYTVRGKQIHFGPSPDSEYSCVIWFRQEPRILRSIDQLLVPEMSEADFDDNPTTEGTFAGGSGYAVGDVITLADGTKVSVEAETSGAVTEFTLVETSTTVASLGDTLSQATTTGSGTGFSLTVGQDNLSNVILIDHPELYLYGAVAEGFLFTKNKRAGEFAGLFKEAIETIAEEDFMSGATPRQLQRLASAGTPTPSR